MKIKLLILIFFIFLLTSCQRTKLEITTFNHGPVVSMIFEKEAKYQRKIILSHSDGVVEKMEIIDTTIFNLEDVDLIDKYDAVNKITYSQDIFQIEGLTQSSKIEDTKYTTTVILEYDKMNMKELIEQENWFVNAIDIVNDNFEVEYNKLEKLILDDGYEKVD